MKPEQGSRAADRPELKLTTPVTFQQNVAARELANDLDFLARRLHEEERDPDLIRRLQQAAATIRRLTGASL